MSVWEYLSDNFALLPRGWQIAWLVVIAMLGACVGSFLNVVIYRVPRDISVNKPKRSFCPKCNKQLKAWHNIPLLSWLLLGAKCGWCKQPIPARYVLVEALVAILFAALWWQVGWPAVLPLWVWVSLAVAISYIDYDHLIVYLPQAWFGILFGVLAALLQPSLVYAEGMLEALWRSAVGVVGGYLLIVIIIELGKLCFGRMHFKYATACKWQLQEAVSDDEQLCFVLEGEQKLGWGDVFVRAKDVIKLQGSLSIDGAEPLQGSVHIYVDKIEHVQSGQVFAIEQIKSAEGQTTEVLVPREAMGQGDAPLLAMVGALGGWQGVVFGIFMASLFGVFGGIIGRLGFGSRLPFGPCLLLAGLLWLFGGQQMWNWYMQLLGY